MEIIAKKVRVLDATNNKITVIPDYLELMVTCNRLGLSKNRITEIPRGISALVNLRVLLLDSNRIRALPRAMFELTKLERLNLAHNYLAEIPRGIRKLKALKYLDVSNNKLVALPREIGDLESLEELHASDNALCKLPVDVAKLERLRMIVAENNMIDAVPSEVLLYCEQMQTMAMHGNPLTLDKLQETKGYREFEVRRQGKWDKAVAAGILLGGNRFDEGVDKVTITPKPSKYSKLDAGGAGAASQKIKRSKSGSSSRVIMAGGELKAHELNISANSPTTSQQTG